MDIIESAKPRASSKIRPAINMLRTLAILFSLLYWAVYRIIAVFNPQSLNVANNAGAPMAIV